MLGLQWIKYWLVAFIGLAAVGVLMLVICIRHNTRHDWYPVNLPLGLEANSTAEGSFVADLDEFYELEIQFEARVSEDMANRLLYPLEQAPMSLEWSVHRGEEKIAQGDSLDYLYLSGKSLKRRIWDNLLRTPDEFGLMPGKIVRGIGAFHATTGERYTVKTNVIDIPGDLAPTRPSLAVRVNRMFSNRHYKEKSATGGAGLLALAAAGPCLALCLLSVWRNKRSKG